MAVAFGNAVVGTQIIGIVAYGAVSFIFALVLASDRQRPSSAGVSAKKKKSKVSTHTSMALAPTTAWLSESR